MKNGHIFKNDKNTFISFQLQFTKTQKKQFCVCRNFAQLCPVNFANFKVYPKKHYDLWKSRFLRIIGKHRGSNQLCPVNAFLPCAALYFALCRPVRFLLNHSETSGVHEVCIFWCESFIEFYRGFVILPCKNDFALWLFVAFFSFKCNFKQNSKKIFVFAEIFLNFAL